MCSCIRGIVVFMAALQLPFFLSGCSFQYIDDYGAKHTWGLVHHVEKRMHKQTTMAEVSQVSTVGVSYQKLESKTGLTLGYARSMEVQIAENVALELSMDLSEPETFNYKDLTDILGEYADVEICNPI